MYNDGFSGYGSDPYSGLGSGGYGPASYRALGGIDSRLGDYGGYSGNGRELRATCYHPLLIPVIFEINSLENHIIYNSSNCLLFL